MTSEELFNGAFGKLDEKKEIARTRRTRIYNFLAEEQPEKRSVERKELKDTISAYLRLMAKVNKAKENPDEAKDPIAHAFGKVNEIVSIFKKLGLTDRLNDYFKLMSECNIEVNADEWKLVKDSAKVDELAKSIGTFDKEAETISEDIKNMAKKAEEDNLCLATRFSKLIKIVKRKKSKDEGAEDLVQQEYLLSSLISKGVDSVLEATEGE